LDGSWSFGPIALTVGQQVHATVLATDRPVPSGPSNVVTVAANTAGVTPAPVITPGVLAGATSVSGTSEPNAVVDVYVDGFYLGTVTADGSGVWILDSASWTSGISSLADGAILTATATTPGSGTSDWSAPVVVGSVFHLLRSDVMTTLVPPPSSLFTHRPQLLPYASLETLGPNHVANVNEKGVTNDPNQPVTPDTADDDRFYMRNVSSGAVDSDSQVLEPTDSRKLIFYELLDNNTKTLKLSKSGGNIVFTITP